MSAPRLKVVCAWCPGFNRPGAAAELTSHGICAGCLARMTDTMPPVFERCIHCGHVRKIGTDGYGTCDSYCTFASVDASEMPPPADDDESDDDESGDVGLFEYNNDDYDDDPDRCEECERSHGPHYRGPCEHRGATIDFHD